MKQRRYYNKVVIAPFWPFILSVYVSRLLTLIRSTWLDVVLHRRKRPGIIRKSSHATTRRSRSAVKVKKERVRRPRRFTQPCVALPRYPHYVTPCDLSSS